MENNKSCKVPGCTNTLSPYNVTGMCGWHSARAEKGLVLDPCSTEGCINQAGNLELSDVTLLNRKCFHCVEALRRADAQFAAMGRAQ